MRGGLATDLQSVRDLMHAVSHVPKPAESKPLRDHPGLPRMLLQGGIAVRILTFWFLAPHNNDNHAGVIQFIVTFRRLPLTLTPHLPEAQHPPLYYLLASPLLALSGSMKVVQAFSLACSIATLLVLYHLIYRERLIESPRARLYSLLVVCFLPQFVMFSLYISNDAPIFLLGAAAILQTYRYISAPGWKQLSLLSLLTGLGLLTKATFLAFVPPLAVLIAFVGWRERLRWRWTLIRGMLFLGIAFVPGSYKFIENYVHYGRPTINAMDFPSKPVDTMYYRGLSSFVDMNIGHLLVSPTSSPATEGAYPVHLYGTFWYQHIPESNFTGNRYARTSYLGVAIYAVSAVPAAVFFLGLLALGINLRPFMKNLRRDASRGAQRPTIEVARRLTIYVAAAVWLTCLASLFVTVSKYHWWPILQGRYLFIAMMGGCGIFAAGVEIVERWRPAAVALQSAMVVLACLFGLYLSSEYGLILLARNPAALHSAKHFLRGG